MCYQDVGLGHTGRTSHPLSEASLVRRRVAEAMWKLSGSRIAIGLEFVTRLDGSEDATPRCPSSRYRIRPTGSEWQAPGASFGERRLALHPYVFSILLNNSE